MVGLQVALVIYTHSVATLKRSTCWYADKTETCDKLFTCVRTALDCLCIYFLVEGRHLQHMFMPASTTRDLRYLLNKPLKSTVLFTVLADHAESRAIHHHLPHCKLVLNLVLSLVWNSLLCKPRNLARMLSQTILAFTYAIRPSFGGKAINTCTIVCCNRALCFHFWDLVHCRKLCDNQSTPLPGAAFLFQSNIRTHLVSI